MAAMIISDVISARGGNQGAVACGFMLGYFRADVFVTIVTAKKFTKNGNMSFCKDSCRNKALLER